MIQWIMCKLHMRKMKKAWSFFHSRVRRTDLVLGVPQCLCDKNYRIYSESVMASG